MKNPSRTPCTEIRPGLYKITLPLPGEKPGPVNAYLFTGSPVTLVDTGTSRSSEFLRHGLRKAGLAFGDIEQVVCTHGHIDHYGAARKIKAESQAQLIMHPMDRVMVEHDRDVKARTFLRFLRMCSVPVKFRIGLIVLMLGFRSMAEKCAVDREVTEDTTLQLGDYQGRVIETPGHSSGSICIYIDELDILLSGDHILPHITPNAFVMLNDREVLPLRRSQEEFYASLAKIEKINPATVLPAHGRIIEDLPRIIASYRKSFNQRLGFIEKFIEKGHTTVYGIAQKLFPVLDKRRLILEIFLMVSEVYSHLQILELQNRARMVRKRGRIRAEKMSL